MSKSMVLLACLVTVSVAGCAPTAGFTMSSVEFALEMKGDPHPFSAPIDVAVDRQGNLFVVDCKHERVQKFDRDGQFLTMWGHAGTGDGEFGFISYDHLPTGMVYTQCLGVIAVDGQGNVYVAEPMNVRIQKLDSNGSFLPTWDGEGRGDGQFIAPIDVAVDGQDDVYVLDMYRDDVQKFDSEGHFLSKWKVGCEV